MLRVPEYWELWGRLLEAEVDKAWRRGDPDRWRSLTEARRLALHIAKLCHEDEVARNEEWRAVVIPDATPAGALIEPSKN